MKIEKKTNKKTKERINHSCGKSVLVTKVTTEQLRLEKSPILTQTPVQVAKVLLQL